MFQFLTILIILGLLISHKYLALFLFFLFWMDASLSMLVITIIVYFLYYNLKDNIQIKLYLLKFETYFKEQRIRRKQRKVEIEKYKVSSINLIKEKYDINIEIPYKKVKIVDNLQINVKEKELILEIKELKNLIHNLNKN